MKTLKLISSDRIPDIKELLTIFEQEAKVKIVRLAEELQYNSNQQNLSILTTVNYELS